MTFRTLKTTPIRLGFLLGLAAALSPACTREAPPSDKDADADTDADTDTDTDTDTDADSDTDTDTDSDTDADVTIYDIQQGVYSIDDFVAVKGVTVTGIRIGSAAGAYVQESAGGQYSGMWAFGAHSALVGDIVTVTGVVGDYNGMTQVHVFSDSAMNPVDGDITFTGVGTPITPESMTLASLAADFEAWEGVLIALDQDTLTVTDDDVANNFGEWEVSDGTTTILIDDQLYAHTPTNGQVYTTIVGALNYSFGAFKLEPRSAADLVLQ